MDQEDVINLFDSCWFHYEIFKKNQSFSYNNFSKIDPSSSSSSSSEPRFSSLRSILVRSKSDDMASFNYGSFSPNSVLFTPVLKSIPSGNNLEVGKQEQEEDHRHQEQKLEAAVAEERENEHTVVHKTKKKKRMTKSLSDLEFEELKGFMDLGFVFSEEDRESSLVEIIPGLQRLGKEKEIVNEDDDDEDEKESQSNDESNSSPPVDGRRPYLSEAWQDLDRRKKKDENNNRSPLMNWRVPALGNEIDMKDSLKLWAQTVASVVR